MIWSSFPRVILDGLELSITSIGVIEEVVVLNDKLPGLKMMVRTDCLWLVSVWQEVIEKGVSLVKEMKALQNIFSG